MYILFNYQDNGVDCAFVWAVEALNIIKESVSCWSFVKKEEAGNLGLVARNMNATEFSILVTGNFGYIAQPCNSPPPPG